MASGRVFLTGGTGYLGGEILNQLLGCGYQVRMLVRKPLKGGVQPGVEPVEGDLHDAGRLAGFMRGCDAVFHCAALVSAWTPHAADFNRTNVEGLQKVSLACAEASIGTLIYTSSFFALESTGPPGARENAAAPARGLHQYQRSKMRARQEAMRLRSEGFPIVILYPGVIYGPGKKTEGNLVSMLIENFVAGKVPGLLAGGRQTWSYAYIKDVARGHLLALERFPSGGEFVLGGENVSLGGFFATLAKLTGRRAPRLRIPVSLGMLAGGMDFALARLRKRPPRITPMAVASMSCNWACDSSHARSSLGYTQTSLKEGLRQTLDWMGIPVRNGPGENL